MPPAYFSLAISQRGVVPESRANEQQSKEQDLDDPRNQTAGIQAGIVATWKSLPPFVKWLVSIIAAWFVTELLSSSLSIVPSPLGAVASIVGFRWTPWILAGFLLVLLVLLWIGARMSISDIELESDEILEAHSELVNSLYSLKDLLDARLSVAMNIIGLQSQVLWSLDNLALSNDVPLACKNLIKVILLENAHILKNIIFRCYVLRPDGDYLVPYVTQQMPEPENYERKFYIGDDPTVRRGVAGLAYVDNSLQITRRVNADDSLESVVADVRFDHKEYITLDDSVPFPQYRAIICTPVRLKESRLGVLCLDSEDANAFDDPEMQQYLSALGILIAFILDLSDKAQQGQ